MSSPTPEPSAASLYDVLGRSGNLATAVGKEAAERLAKVSGGTVVSHTPPAAITPESMMGVKILVYVCEDCGYIEGSSPQAGCCPECGRGSNAIPYLARIEDRAGQLEKR